MQLAHTILLVLLLVACSEPLDSFELPILDSLGPIPLADSRLLVEITATGQIRIDGEHMDEERLMARLRLEVARFPGEVVAISQRSTIKYTKLNVVIAAHPDASVVCLGRLLRYLYSPSIAVTRIFMLATHSREHRPGTFALFEPKYEDLDDAGYSGLYCVLLDQPGAVTTRLGPLEQQLRALKDKHGSLERDRPPACKLITRAETTTQTVLRICEAAYRAGFTSISYESNDFPPEKLEPWDYEGVHTIKISTLEPDLATPSRARSQSTSHASRIRDRYVGSTKTRFHLGPEPLKR